jgi:hypothetical protein
MTDENSQKEPLATPRPEGPGTSLTISPRRLAGSVRCLNCGTALEGPFCHYCGQPDKNFMRFFPVLMREFLEDFLELDSRFTRTMKPLLVLPGKLTRDYLDGRRFRYTPPLRLYIFSSMLFFILAAMLAGSAITIDSSDLSDTGIGAALSVESADPEKLEKVREALDQLDPELAEKVELAIRESTETPESRPADEAEVDSKSFGLTVNLGDEEEDEEEDEDDTISFNDEPWDKETNPLIIPLMPDFVNNWINDEIEESPQKGKEIEANPNLIIDKVFEVLPVTMFILLPLVALLLKFWYMFAGKYYIEHLILALHNHSFLFVVFLLIMILNSLAGWREPNEEGWITTAANLFNVAMLVWVPIYFLLSLKRVYQQGWTMTLGKYFVISLSYLILLALATSVVALMSFVLL